MCMNKIKRGLRRTLKIYEDSCNICPYNATSPIICANCKDKNEDGECKYGIIFVVK